MKYKVIDNFLDEEYFNELVSLLTDKEFANNIMPWFLQTAITTTPEHRPVTEDKIFILYHMILKKLSLEIHMVLLKKLHIYFIKI